MMESLIIQEFTGSKTSKSTRSINGNAVYKSRLRDFNKKLNQTNYSLKLPLSGEEFYQTNDSAYKLDSDHYLITNPNDTVEAYVKSENDVFGLCIYLSTDYINDVTSSMSAGLEKTLDAPFKNSDNVSFLISENRIGNDPLSELLKLFKEDILSGKTEKYDADEFYTSIAELLIQKELKVRSDISSLPQLKLSSKTEILKRVTLMNEYIEDNFRNEISLDELSKISALSKYHALRCYQNIYKITPYKKVRILRLEESRQLIKTGMSMTDIAFELSFSDVRSFSKAFKNYFGKAPSSFKEK